jgi:S1-C subfamily serine protease
VQPPPAKPTTPEDIPLLRQGHEGCVHCHQVREYRLLQAAHDGTFTRRQLFVFPLPESLGIEFAREHGHRIARVLPGSPAAESGLAPGDTVVRVNGVPIHSEYDVRWALERAADDQPLLFTVERGTAGNVAEAVPISLTPRGDWRQTELGWRKSLRSVPFPLGMLGYALGKEELRKESLPDDRLAIRVLSIRGAGLAKNLALEKGDLIVAVAGRSQPRNFEEFKSDLLRLFAPGETVEVTVLRNGQLRQLRGLFPAWHTTETSVP